MPFLFHSECVSNTEKTFSLWRITFCRRIRWSVLSTWRYECAMYRPSCTSSFGRAPRSGRLAARVAIAFGPVASAQQA